MSGAMRMVRWIGRWLGRGRLERQLDDEVRFHLAMRKARLMRDGLSADEAERAARARFGDVDEVKAKMRAARRPRSSCLLWRPFPTAAIASVAVATMAVGAWWLLGGPRETPVFEIGDQVSAPRLLEESKPRYTAAAMEAGVQGGVLLTCVVETDGTCTDIDVVQSLDQRYGLDRQATRALERWRFAPGTRRGQAVPVQVTVEMMFTLR